MSKQNGVRCDDEFQAQIEEAARARGWSVPDLFRESARQYIKGDEFHRLLVDFEKRQGGSFKSMHREIRRLRNEMQVLMTVQELFIKSYFMHTPPVPEEAKPVAKAQAMERWDKLVRAIADVMQVGGSLSSITVALDSAGLDG